MKRPRQNVKTKPSNLTQKSFRYKDTIILNMKTTCDAFLCLLYLQLYWAHIYRDILFKFFPSARFEQGNQRFARPIKFFPSIVKLRPQLING
mmetsp:Transcript_11835/g.25618  ORF Transcript_11835/g.25618 Transcript_11835/m.25618 type:complete len:92 (-) Transcript_11835:1158-1433(-)